MPVETNLDLPYGILDFPYDPRLIYTCQSNTPQSGRRAPSRTQRSPVHWRGRRSQSWFPDSPGAVQSTTILHCIIARRQVHVIYLYVVLKFISVCHLHLLYLALWFLLHMYFMHLLYQKIRAQFYFFSSSRWCGLSGYSFYYVGSFISKNQGTILLFLVQ